MAEVARSVGSSKTNQLLHVSLFVAQAETQRKAALKGKMQACKKRYGYYAVRLVWKRYYSSLTLSRRVQHERRLCFHAQRKFLMSESQIFSYIFAPDAYAKSFLS